MAAYESWTLEASSADPDGIPTWVSLKPWARTTTPAQPIRITRGRRAERDDIQAGTLVGSLDNSDHRFTVDNPSSAFTWWGQRRKIRLVETADGTDFDRFTGYTRPTELVDWAETQVDQLASVAAVDLLGRLDDAPEFRGTLAECVRSQAGLVEWWPLDDDTTTEWLSETTGAVARRQVTGWSSDAITADPDDLLIPARVAGPPGDDRSYPQWVMVGPSATSDFAQAWMDATVSVTAGLTDTIAVSAWVRLDDYTVSPEPQGLTVQLFQTGAHELSLYKRLIGSDLYTGARLYHPTVGSYGYIDGGRPYERQAWRLVTVRYNLATGTYEFWSGADCVASSTYAVPAAPMTLDTLRIGIGWSGSIAHLQIRVGSGVMSYAEHLAQYAVGIGGLHRQTVAERITTLAGYAGVATADLNISTAASTPMQAAQLSGRKPAAVLRSAAETEGGGRLLVSGDGKLTMQPRSARYNQAVAHTVPYAWLERGLRYREEKPINTATASRVSGGQTRRTDTASITRYGVGEASTTLDTAIDADPANWAAWTIQTGATPRVRCPQLRIDLLPRTDVERAQLLAIDIGDRIQITGLPTTVPTGTADLIVEGITDEIGVEVRRITLVTSPLLGEDPGDPPYCPMVGDLVSTTAVIAY